LDHILRLNERAVSVRRPSLQPWSWTACVTLDIGTPSEGNRSAAVCSEFINTVSTEFRISMLTDRSVSDKLRSDGQKSYIEPQ
jgi:hypothetical protein